MSFSKKLLTSSINDAGHRRMEFRSSLFLVWSIVFVVLAGPTCAHSKPAVPRNGPATRLDVSPRVEDPNGFSRLTFPAVARGAYSFRRDGDKIVIARPRGTRSPDLPQLPRNVLEMSSDAATTVLTVRAGARTRIGQIRGSLVLTMYDPVGPGTDPEAARDGKLAANTSASQPGAVPASAETAAPRPVAAPDVDTKNNADPQSQSATLELAKPTSTQIQTIPGVGEPAILLPAAGDAGLAAFQLRDEAVIVLDKPFDFQPPAPDSPFTKLISRKTEDATIIRIPLQDPSLIRIDRSPQGWTVTAASHTGTANDVIPLPIEVRPGMAGIRLAVSAPGRVVSIRDPQNGRLFLLGTQNATGQAVLEPRDYSQYRLLPTAQGVVVSPVSDDVILRREGPGFVLTAGSPGGAAGQQGVETSATASTPVRARLFDLRDEPGAALFGKLQHELRAVSEAPALARTDLRLKIGETMVALGLGVEAQSVLDVATADDPSLLNLPYAIGLRAAAAMLSGRLDAASGIADPRLSATADGRLWRSLLAVLKEQVSPEDAKTLAAEMPVLLSYPPTLRDRILPRALESIAMSGQAALARNVLKALPATPELDLARGITFEMSGQSADALHLYDVIAERLDRRAAYQASIRAAELRMKLGMLDNRTGADALDRSLFGWREASQEIPLRIRIASLRRQAGQWREALTVLKDGIVGYPEHEAQLDGELAQTLLALFTGDGAKSMAPSDLVAIYDKNIETVRSMSWPEQTGLKMADCLIGLGLTARAEPVLAKIVAQAADPARRSFLGARLADVRMDMNDLAGAIAALAATAPASGVTLDASLLQGRQMLYAQAEARRGNTDAALSMFQTIGTAEADSARADILVARKDWTHAVSALTALEQKRVPQSGGLTEEQQAIVTRLAVAAALSEDAATLKRIKDSYGKEMTATASASLFRIITSSPVHGTADLPRAFEEIELARKMTAQNEVRTSP